jgi:phage tail sheath gpL-like
MAVTHNVPAATRTPGTYIEFNIAAAARGLTPLGRRLVLIGCKTSAGEQDELVPVQVFSEADADRLFGIGSPLALMCKWALRGGVDFGAAAELWAGAQDEESGGTAAENTITITGDADEGSDIVIEIAGRVVRASVAADATPTEQAAALVDAIDAMAAELPVTAASALGVVTTTATTKGVNGSDLTITVTKPAAGTSIALAESVAGAGVVDITAALDTLAAEEYDWIALENHAAADVADLATHMAAMWASGVKQWRFSLIGETGDLSTIDALAAAADDFKQGFAWSEDNPLMPGEVAAYVGMMYAAKSPTRNTTLNGQPLPRLPIPPKASLPTPGPGGEIESALAGGVTPLTTNSHGTQMQIVRAVCSKTTHNSAPFFVMLDTLIAEGMVYVARQLDIAWAVFNNAKKTARVKSAIRSVGLARLKQIEALEVIQNVDQHKGEFEVDDDPESVDAVVAAVPASVVPGLNKLIGVINLRVE